MDEREWVRVERGRRRSECNPVRHIHSRRGEFRSGEAHRLGKAEEHRKFKVVRREEGQIVRSFLVRNFPPDCSPGELIAKCREVGPVVDLFCPKKRDVKGKKFGFVRIAMEKTEEVEEVLRLLNSLWIDSYKLQAFLPLFGRKEMVRADAKREKRFVEQTKPVTGYEEHRVSVSAEVQEGISFLQKAKGCPVSEPLPSLENWKTSFVPDKHESVWLDQAWVGRLKPEFSWEDYREDISQESKGRKIEVTFMGDDLLLLKSVESEGDKGGTLLDWGNYWCSWVRPWKPSDVCKRQVVWTSWFGVPLHAWSERFFKQLSKRFGVFLDWDWNTQKKASLDRARVKIRGSSLKFINETVTVEIDRVVFPITIVEESGNGEANEDQVEDDSSVDSQESDGDNLWAGIDLVPRLDPKGGKPLVGVKHGGAGDEAIIDFGNTRIEAGRDENRSDGCGFEGKGKSVGHADSRIGGTQGSHGTCAKNVGGLVEPNLNSPLSKPNPFLGPSELVKLGYKAHFDMDQAQQDGQRDQSVSQDSMPFPPGWGPLPLFQSPPQIGSPDINRKEVCGSPKEMGAQVDSTIVRSNAEREVADSPSIETFMPKESREDVEPSIIAESMVRSEVGKVVERADQNPPISSRGGRKSIGTQHRRKVSKKVLKIREGKKLDAFLKDMHSPSDSYPRSFKATRRNRKTGKKYGGGKWSEAEEIAKLGLDLGLKANVPEKDLEGKLQQLMESTGGDAAEAEGVDRRIVNEDC